MNGIKDIDDFIEYCRKVGSITASAYERLKTVIRDIRSDEYE